MGTQTLAKANAIMKRLRSTETLGSTSAINSDKTGTLTLNQMTAVELAIPGRRYSIDGNGYSTQGAIKKVAGQVDVDLEPFMQPLILACDAVVHDGELIGDPTEGALVVLGEKGGLDTVTTRETYPRVAELPFDAAYKLMATFHEMKDESGQDVVRCFVKGAPDQLLARAATTLVADDLHPVEVTDEMQAGATRPRTSGSARRACASSPPAARTSIPPTFDPSADLLPLLDGLTVLALVGIVDPPRPTAKDAIATAHSAGIQVRMITGDHAVTAAAIAKDLGITGRAITGAEFGAMSDDELLAQIDDIGVIARVTPEHKVRLVDTLKRKGLIVAMTGDGVNDAPALKRADIGIAMGITGTEVSKEAAAMILTDDNFATIVRAVELGRGLYDNLTKYIRFQMGVLFGLVFTFLGRGDRQRRRRRAVHPAADTVGQLHDAGVPGDRARLRRARRGADGHGNRATRTPRSCRARSCCGSPCVGAVMGGVTIGVIAWGDHHYGDGGRPHDGHDLVRDREPLLFVLRARRADVGLQPRRPARRRFLMFSGTSVIAIVLGPELSVLNRILHTTP